MLDNLDLSTFNYLEINILNKHLQLNDIIDINWDYDKFIKLLKIIINNNNFSKPFEKQFRVMKYRELVYVTSLNDNKYNLYNLDLNDYEVKDKMIILKYRKNVLPVYQFPSTDEINDKYYLNKIVFKITNLIYLNFEIKRKSDVEKYYRVYINFNNDRKNIDRDVIIKNIELTLSNLKKILN